MPRFAANLSMLFQELPFMERFAAARQAGFEAVECQFPYAHGSDELARSLRPRAAPGLHNLPAGDWQAGERGIACHPQRVAEFREGVEQAIEYANALGCPQLNCLAGIVPAGLTPAEAERTLVANLRYASARLHSVGIRLLIEPINALDIPGFF
jgi:hydroxypyruvate isomerase